MADEDQTFISRITFFPKLKMKVKGERFETVSDIQRESQVVLDSIKENNFAFKVCCCILSKGGSKN
jgi:hypothetical protein